MAEPPFGSTLLNVWEEYRRCAHQAGQIKAHLTRVRIVALALVIAGAVCGLLADQILKSPEVARGLAAASAVALGLAAYFTKEGLDARLERQWVLARSPRRSNPKALNLWPRHHPMIGPIAIAY
jgi:hypothetical protein